MIVYAEEKAEDCYRDMVAIGELHWHETEAYRHGQGYNPDIGRYLQYARMGLYHCFTVRADGLLVGYGGIYCMPSMHTGKLVVTEDTYYIHPDYRRGRVALKLFKMMEDKARALGAVEVLVSTKVGNPRAETIVRYMGYELVERRWSKSLTETKDVQLRSAATA